MIIYLIPLARDARTLPRRSETGATMRVMRRYPGIWRTGCPFPVLSCTAWGFSCLGHRWPSGELLPRHFTFARRPLARPSSRMFSV